MTSSIIILMFLMALSDGLDEEVAIQKMIARFEKAGEDKPKKSEKHGNNTQYKKR